MDKMEHRKKVGYIKYRLKSNVFFRLYKYLKDPSLRKSFGQKYRNNLQQKAKARLAYFLYGFDVRDFYRLKFEHLPLKQISGFLPFKKCSLFYSSVNLPICSQILGDKYRLYQRMPELYGRAVVSVLPTDNPIEIINTVRSAFAEKGGKLVFKPFNANRGQGIVCYESVSEVCSKLPQLTQVGGGIRRVY